MLSGKKVPSLCINFAPTHFLNTTFVLYLSQGSLCPMSFNWYVFAFQNNVVQLLETALVAGADREPDPSQPCSVYTLVDLLPLLTVKSGDTEWDNHIKCNLQGTFSVTIFLPILAH